MDAGRFGINFPSSQFLLFYFNSSLHDLMYAAEIILIFGNYLAPTLVLPDGARTPRLILFICYIMWEEILILPDHGISLFYC